jgi:fructose-1,6-bisphosphatase-3
MARIPLDRVASSELAGLNRVAKQFPNRDSAVAEIARLQGEARLPVGSLHVISDIHGEDAKLRHVLHNGSGTLRPLIEELFASELDSKELKRLVSLFFYPDEMLALERERLGTDAELDIFFENALARLVRLVRVISRNRSISRIQEVADPAVREFLLELACGPSSESQPEFQQALLRSVVAHGRGARLVHQLINLIRGLAVEELIIGGDCWDRGPRGDKVVEHLMHQPRLSFIWGNHDMAWVGAAMGHGACIAHVCRISLRYGRLEQLEEGYGIPMWPLIKLAQTVYADDPAKSFKPKLPTQRDPQLVARMQKAAAIIQFKLEAAAILRHPEWNLDNRRLLHHISDDRKTITIEGREYPLSDTAFPTIRPDKPYELSPEEETCLSALSTSFNGSLKLKNQVRFLHRHGSLWLVRRNHLVFHACIPCDEAGEFLPLEVDGKMVRGRAMFEALELLIARVFDQPVLEDLDWMWYLWCGPLSPLFGKDKIATFEIDFVANHSTHKETKNPYFNLINETWFCDKVLAEFGVDTERGLIVNGHVPVKIEKGENPVKKSGKAITIDGAFSEAYGDYGYTLLVEPAGTFLALHHHFDQVEKAVRDGVDIIPQVSVIREEVEIPRRGDTEEAQEMAATRDLLERLVMAYRANQIPEIFTVKS